MLNKIAIYNGEGVSQTLLSALQTHFPDALMLGPQELIHTSWDADLLILPGGRDRPYHRDLSGAGNQRIRQFVEGGKTYLGICAGAYFASAAIDFERSTQNEVLEERQLKFFSGTAIGSAYGIGHYEPHSDRGLRTAQIRFQNEIYPVYFNGGCTFKHLTPETEILASYSDLPNEPPAIIACSVGRGRAILSGVHIEKNPTLLRHVLEYAASDQMKMQMENCLA